MDIIAVCVYSNFLIFYSIGLMRISFSKQMFILREPYLLVSLNLSISHHHLLSIIYILVICNLYKVLLRGSQMFLTPIETLHCARSWGVLSRTLRCLFRTIQTDQFLCACPNHLIVSYIRFPVAHGYWTPMDVLVRTTISADLTTPTCRSLYESEFRENHFLTSLRRKVLTKLISPSKTALLC